MTDARYRDYPDRLDLVICGDCSTPDELTLIARDETAEHDTKRHGGDTRVHLQKVADAWVEWAVKTSPDVLLTITHVHLNGPGRGGYDIHMGAWEADQKVVDQLAEAIGCASSDGWVPKSGHTAHQWNLSYVDENGFDWHVTATTPEVKQAD
jgi:hypothetical protein